MDKRFFLRELKARYRQLYNATHPISYIRNKHHCLERVFVEGGTEYLAGSWLTLDSYHLVFREPRMQSGRRLLIGEPGCGKSTLVLQYVYDWCNEVQESYLKNVEILILFRMRQLGGVTSLYTAIKRLILSPRSQLSEHDIESVLNNSQSVLIILDGLDEYPDEGNRPLSDFMNMLMTPVFHRFEVLLTSRYLPKQFAPETRRFRLVGFDERMQDEYILKFIAEDNLVGANDMKQRLQENPVLGDICQVPFFFAMFCQMSHENKDFPTFSTVTSFFKYMVQCFHNHIRNKMENANDQWYHLFEKEHTELDRVAFEGLSNMNQQIVWKKPALINRLGKEFYDHYIRTGILVEEQVMNDIQPDRNSTYNNEKDVRFYHKLFCEWYGAHHIAKYAIELKDSKKLSKLLRFINPLDLQYCYRFACGLEPDATSTIVKCMKQKDGGGKFAALCVLEQGFRLEGIFEIAEEVCKTQIQLNPEQNNLLQRATIRLLESASKHNIPISRIWLNKVYSTVNLRDRNHLQLRSSLSVPILTSLNALWIKDPGREITSPEFTGILQYSEGCSALEELLFRDILLPKSVQFESLSALRSRNVRVFWNTGRALYLLNLQSCLWERISNTISRRVIGIMTDDLYQELVKEFGRI